MLSPIRARATIGVLVGEPFGSFGTMLPTGHTSLFLDHICAATPTSFRPCAPGEPGVVLSRWHDLSPSELDWFAVPVVPFLYGVQDAREVPGWVTPALAARLRDDYRRTQLAAILPTQPRGTEWAESVGSAFDRQLFLYEVDTTPAEDALLLTWLNALPNRRRYSLAHANCANFVADAFNLLHPGAVRRNHLADFNLLTPRQVARSVEQLGDAHPDLHLRVYVIPQLPGTLRRSRPARGASEMFLTTKRYLAALLLLQPEAVAADWIVYEKAGRWRMGEYAVELTPADWPALTLYARRSECPVPPPSDGGAACARDLAYSLPSSRSTASSTASPATGFRAK